MKDSHIYQRLNEEISTNAILMLINQGPSNLAHALYNNINENANDHPKFNEIKKLYNFRFKKNNLAM